MVTLNSLNDITIIPEVFTNITSRKQCDPWYHWNITNGVQLMNLTRLPIFAAPMSNTISLSNWKNIEATGINVVIPRNIPLVERKHLMSETFVALSLDEFITFIDDAEYALRELHSTGGSFVGMYYVCVDLANGHMSKLYDVCTRAKQVFDGRIQIMTGNIANPKTYLEIAKIGCIDYIRVGIGSGNVCTTSANTAIHFPMASLIMECHEYRKNLWQYPDDYHFPKIVADGGFKNYDQIIKALALGADFVMTGEIIARSEEACGKIHMKFNPKFYKKGEKLFKKYREYYGMSTKKAQKEFGKEGNKTAEGIVKLVEVSYNLSGWVDNFVSYLKSAMSYTNCYRLGEFIGGPEVALMTPTAFASFYK